MSNSTNNILTVSDHDIATFMTQLQQIAVVLALGFEPLSPAEARRKPRLFAKRQKAVAEILQVAGAYGITAPNVSPTAVQGNLDTAAKLRPVLTRVEALQKVLSDMILVSGSEAWTSASTLYGVLQGNAKTNPVLREALQPIRDQLRVPRRPKATVKPATSAPPAAEEVAATTK